VVPTLASSLGSYSRNRSNYVLQDSIFLLPDQSLVVEPLLRWNQVDGEGHLSWSLGASWNFRENWYLKGSGGYSHRAPNLYEMYGDGSMIVPNAGLDWEEGFQWDLGVYWAREGEGWSSRVGLTSFVLDMDNLIEFVMINPRYGVYQNMGKAFISGMELESAFSWDAWSLALSYTWMEGENRSPGYRYGQPLPNRPEHALYGRLSRALSPELLAFGELIHTGENYFDDAGSILYGDCTQWNLGLKWQFREDATLGVGVRDLLDTTSEITFQPLGYGPERLAWYPLPGRTWYLSLSWRF
jgi:outer membrane receptor protein involved in Fe transport